MAKKLMPGFCFPVLDFSRLARNLAVTTRRTASLSPGGRRDVRWREGASGQAGPCREGGEVVEWPLRRMATSWRRPAGAPSHAAPWQGVEQAVWGELAAVGLGVRDNVR